jgi:hypothetical protein
MKADSRGQLAQELKRFLDQLVSKGCCNFTVEIRARRSDAVKFGHCDSDGKIVVYYAPGDKLTDLLTTALHELAHHLTYSKWKAAQIKRYGHVAPLRVPGHGARFQTQLRRLANKFNASMGEALNGLMTPVCDRRKSVKRGVSYRDIEFLTMAEIDAIIECVNRQE